VIGCLFIRIKRWCSRIDKNACYSKTAFNCAELAQINARSFRHKYFYRKGGKRGWIIDVYATGF
jgi:hypothetical protein